MKMIILGNGFDLASKLPTGYFDYFDVRFEKVSYLERIVDEILEASEFQTKYFEEILFIQIKS